MGGIEPSVSVRWSTPGEEVTVPPVDGGGRVSARQVAAALRPDTAPVSVMLANNELSTIRPVVEIGAVTRAAGVPLHCNAPQGAGSPPVDVRALGVDLLTFSGHKIYGPKGTGVLYVSNGPSDRAPLAPLLHGGGQERGPRAGTVNTAAVIGLGAAVGVLAAAGPAPERIRGSIRVGFGRFTTEEDAVRAARALAAGVSGPAARAAA
ncbi:aminotransferase class V-fold PLP-dependent enzyme [Streptomyces vietnamensis]|uniref:aminotransferase class V-fold PLP-dependent enzyme n=1 Tax=Streptomyces vietnamensis TaxID=362257 RepID=UPI003439C019